MRYKEFNSNRVLEKCIVLFWNKGFGGCSVKKIVDETTVNRFSLYNEFKNKEGILYAALQLYKERYSNKKLAISHGKSLLHDEIISFLSEFLLDENSHPPGCFIIHIATELADNDEKVKSILDNYCIELEEIFLAIVEKFQPNHPNNKFYSKHLVVLFCSSMCHCVIQSHKQRIEHISSSIKILLNKKAEYAANA